MTETTTPTTLNPVSPRPRRISLLCTYKNALVLHFQTDDELFFAAAAAADDFFIDLISLSLLLFLLSLSHMNKNLRHSVRKQKEVSCKSTSQTIAIAL